MNSQIIQDHKYHDSDAEHTLYQREASEASEEDDSRNSYQQPTWQPPTQIHYPSQKDQVKKIEETDRIGTTCIQSSFPNYHRNISQGNENTVSNMEQR